VDGSSVLTKETRKLSSPFHHSMKELKIKQAVGAHHCQHLDLGLHSLWNYEKQISMKSKATQFMVFVIAAQTEKETSIHVYKPIHIHKLTVIRTLPSSQKLLCKYLLLLTTQ
jgi:hypothetical protein